MRQGVDDTERVQIFGRWDTGMSHIHVCESHEPARPVARGMAGDIFHIHLWEPYEPMRPVARVLAGDRSELTQPLAAMRRSTAEAGLSEEAGPAGAQDALPRGPADGSRQP